MRLPRSEPDAPVVSGTTRATGRPRLVTTRERRRRSTSSKIARHFALNSPAGIVAPTSRASRIVLRGAAASDCFFRLPLMVMNVSLMTISRNDRDCRSRAPRPSVDLMLSIECADVGFLGRKELRTTLGMAYSMVPRAPNSAIGFHKGGSPI